jgi:DNA-binding NtrC family response regulator
MSSEMPSEMIEETLRSGTGSFPVQTVRVVVQAASAPIVAEGESVSIGTADGNRLVVNDPSVSRYHLEVLATPRGIRLRDLGSTNGTYVGVARIETAEVRPGTIVRIGETTALVEAGSGGEVDLLPPGDVTFHGLVGMSPAMRRLFAQIQRAASSPAAVLLSGESGTGKEVVAEALHRASARAGAPFVVVDCGALVPALVASELFGHERGAFTGADRQHVGAFERAQGGTLLLDEIGELPSVIQPALLGALERRRIRRVGGKVDIPVDVRILAATHRDLREEVNAGRFRLDLYYRLAVIVLSIPPLRERMDDLPLLVAHFARVAGFAGALEELVSEAALGTLRQSRFEGNLRELRNVVEALLAMGELPGGAEPPTAPAAVVSPPMVGGDLFARASTLPYRQARALVLREFEADYVGAILARSGGNIAAAARGAGMDRSYLSEIVSKLRSAEAGEAHRTRTSVFSDGGVSKK